MVLDQIAFPKPTGGKTVGPTSLRKQNKTPSATTIIPRPLGAGLVITSSGSQDSNKAQMIQENGEMELINSHTSANEDETETGAITAHVPPQPVDQDETDCIILDSKDSDRRHYRERFTGVLREVWRPGDGDGKRGADYFGKHDPPSRIGDRWRFYQSPTGNGPVKRDSNEPPKFVILDDRNAYEVLVSDIPRSRLLEAWSHDFSGIGVLRSRRAHRGRGAVGDPEAPGVDKYYFTTIRVQSEKYYFTGERNYRPVIYRSSECETEPDPPKARRPWPPPDIRDRAPAVDSWNRPKHGHNQYTAKDQLVKYGAPSLAKNAHRPRVIADEHHQMNQLRLYRQEQRTPSIHTTATAATAMGDVEHREGLVGNNSSWVGDDDTPPGKKRKRVVEYEPVCPQTKVREGSSSSMDEFPFVRRTLTKTAPHEDSTALASESSRHHKVSPAQDCISRPFADHPAETQNTIGSLSDHKPGARDSGSYAAQLEEQLLNAQAVIEKQRGEITQLKDTQK